MTELTRHEQTLAVTKEEERAGTVRARKVTETDHVAELVGRDIEDADVERHAPAEADSGEIETLGDGSISIPLFEERLVITRDLVVRERVVIRKRTTTERQQVEADLRRERLVVDADSESLLEEGDAYGDDTA